MSEEHESAGEMKKARYWRRGIIAHDQPAEVVEPGKEPFDFPGVAIAAQTTAIVEGSLVRPVRCGARGDVFSSNLSRKGSLS